MIKLIFITGQKMEYLPANDLPIPSFPYKGGASCERNPRDVVAVPGGVSIYAACEEQVREHFGALGQWGNPFRQ